MQANLGVSPAEIGYVIISTIGIYFAFLALIRLFGQRALTSMSSFDFAAVIALGSLTGRVILGYTPTLAAGIIGLFTLFAIQAIVGKLRQTEVFSDIVNNHAYLLMAGPEILWDNLARNHITEPEMRSILRGAGIRTEREVALVILESTGKINVLKRGEKITPTMLSGVRSKERIPADLLENPAQENPA